MIETDILICGAGPAGRIAAAAFHAEGFDVTLADPNAAPPPGDLRSTAFLAPSVGLLKRAGLWDRLAPIAAPLDEMRIIDAGGAENIRRTDAQFDSGEIGDEPFGWNIPNKVLKEALTDLPDIRFVTAGLSALTPRGNRMIASLGETQIAARLVIGADGRNSTTRALSDIGAKTWHYGQKALVFTVAHELPHDNRSTEIHRSGGPFTLVPMRDQDGVPHSAVVWMERGPEAARLMEMDDAAFEEAVNARSCLVLGPLRVTSARGQFPIISRLADRLDGPRVALIAEAAHAVPPIGAQGLNMSIGDVEVLLDLTLAAREAGEDIGSPALLRRYHMKRWPELRARVAGIDMLNRASMAESQTLRDLRNSGLKLLDSVTPLKRLVMRLGRG
ncbi:FAD-dependent monooxygenase [Paracoccaceae bacterium GXU_MW_L88]